MINTTLVLLAIIWGAYIFMSWRLQQVYKYMIYLLYRASDKDISNFILYKKETDYLHRTPKLDYKTVLLFWRPLNYYVDPKFIEEIHNLD